MVGGRLGLSRRRNDVGRRGFNPQSGIYGPMSESIDYSVWQYILLSDSIDQSLLLKSIVREYRLESVVTVCCLRVQTRVCCYSLLSKSIDQSLLYSLMSESIDYRLSESIDQIMSESIHCLRVQSGVYTLLWPVVSLHSDMVYSLGIQSIVWYGLQSGNTVYSLVWSIVWEYSLQSGILYSLGIQSTVWEYSPTGRCSPYGCSLYSGKVV